MKSKIFHTHKKSSILYKHIQDKFCVNGKISCIAIADGTTQSFRSEYWSELLVTEFCQNPTFNSSEFIIWAKHLAEKIQSTNPKFSENPAIASLERRKFNNGSTSTFMGIQFVSSTAFNFISVGDCNLFLIRNSGEISTFPFDSIDGLNENSSFLNTVNLLNETPSPIEFYNKEINFEKGDEIILCTDAISRLFLSDRKWIKEIVSLDNFENFIERIEELWAANLLEEDDITIIYLSDLNSRSIDIIPPADFSFPSPPPPPPPIPPIGGEGENNNLIFTSMDIQTIMHNFSCIQKDFSEIKKRQKLHENLLLVISGLLTLILVVLFFQVYMDTEPISDSSSTSKSEKNLPFEKTFESGAGKK
jgi:serine/threonine protein phosphatase PrpC